MGFLEVGTPLSWEESASVRAYVKKHGLYQLLNVWRANKDRVDTHCHWGEEVEYSLVHLKQIEGGIKNSDGNPSTAHSQVYAKASEVLEELGLNEAGLRSRSPYLTSEWHPEFSNHMVEAIPAPPYKLSLNSILLIEPSMRLRRAKIQGALPSGVYVTSQTAFPGFGVPDFVYPPEMGHINLKGATGSVFVPDAVINPHPRFPTLVRNVRRRRGAKPFMLIPVYQDRNTSTSPIWERSMPREAVNRFSVETLAQETPNPVKDYIYMDCFAFGMGMSCVQMTFGAPDMSAARYLYDQLLVLAPLFLALTASTPALRGLLAATDTRWDTLEQAVDCRTEEECADSIPKSRYSAASLYIADCGPLVSRGIELNDSDAPISEEAFEMLQAAGMDKTLARHYAHLWIRDPLVIFSERVELDDSTCMDHFENIQSTNWNSVRFKPPPLSPNLTSVGPIPWRVEFRSPEAQLTDFDNAACVAVITVLSKVILRHKLDFYIPMTKNDENMAASWQKAAITQRKFWFRHQVSTASSCHQCSLMTLEQIFTGCSTVGFPGLLPLCKEYIAAEITAKQCRSSVQNLFNVYSDVIEGRVSGRLMTTASLLRRFVSQHPSYQHDSVLSPEVVHDMTVLSTNIGLGVWLCPKLHGTITETTIPRAPLSSGSELPKMSSNGYKALNIVPLPLSKTLEPSVLLKLNGHAERKSPQASVLVAHPIKESPAKSPNACDSLDKAYVVSATAADIASNNQTTPPPTSPSTTAVSSTASLGSEQSSSSSSAESNASLSPTACTTADEPSGQQSVSTRGYVSMMSAAATAHSDRITILVRPLLTAKDPLASFLPSQQPTTSSDNVTVPPFSLPIDVCPRRDSFLSDTSSDSALPPLSKRLADHCVRKRFHGIITSEDFTRCWLTKGCLSLTGRRVCRSHQLYRPPGILPSQDGDDGQSLTELARAGFENEEQMEYFLLMTDGSA